MDWVLLLYFDSVRLNIDGLVGNTKFKYQWPPCGVIVRSPDGNLLPTKAMSGARDEAAGFLTASLRGLDQSESYTSATEGVNRPDRYIDLSIC